ncbi:MAG: hypothetical protein ABI002_10190, partial [Saprospiraceae bacterium]
MAVRKDSIQIDLTIVTKDQAQFNNLVKTNYSFIKELKEAQGDATKLTTVMQKINASGREISKIDIGNLSRADLVNRAKQLQEILHRIPQSTPGFNALETELKQINTQMAVLRTRSAAVDGAVEANRSSLSRMLGSLKAVGAGFIAGFSVQAVISAGKELFKTAVSMDLLSKKAKTVFGESTGFVEEFATKNAAAMGLTRSQYIGAAAAIGDLLIPMGFQRKEGAQLSTQLVNLSGALAEWSGGKRTAVEVSEILSKAMLGEREQLKELGISIKEEDVTRELQIRKMDKLTGQSLEQAKAMVTLDLITRKSTDAQTAFASGSDGLARSQSRLTAGLEVIKEKLALSLIPIFAKLVGGLADTVAGSDKASVAVSNLQTEFNRDIETLKRGNISKEARIQLISRINQKYEEYLPKLITEKSSLEDITKAQDSANAAFNTKITLLAAEEVLVAAKKKSIALVAEEIRLNAELSKQQDLLAKALVERGNRQGPASRTQEDPSILAAEARDIAQKRITQNLTDQQKNLDDLERLKIQAQKVGADVDAILNGKPPAAVSPGGGGNGTTDNDVKERFNRAKNLVEEHYARLDLLEQIHFTKEMAILKIQGQETEAEELKHTLAIIDIQQ